MAIKLNAATGGGSVALDAPNSTDSNADVVLTLPTNDGDSGQYLQTNGTGTLSWQTVTDTNTQDYTWLAGTLMTGSGTITITGIDTDATDIILLFEDVGMASTGWMQFRVGNGSEDTGNNYDWSTSTQTAGTQFASANTIFRINHTGNTNSSHRWNGHVRLIRNDDDHFILTSVLGTIISAPAITGGRWYGGTTGIDRVSISTGTGNFVSGRVTVGYIV